MGCKYIAAMDCRGKFSKMSPKLFWEELGDDLWKETLADLGAVGPICFG